MFMRNMCYKVLLPRQSWNQSVNSCSLEGGHLMTRQESADILVIKVLRATSGQTQFWLGGMANKVFMYMNQDVRI